MGRAAALAVLVAGCGGGSPAGGGFGGLGAGSGTEPGGGGGPAGPIRQEYCPVGFGDCDYDPDRKCETDLRRSAEHCGECDRACPDDNGEGLCRKGRCVTRCDAGFQDCNGLPEDGCETEGRCPPCGDGACHPVSESCVSCARDCGCCAGRADCNGDPRDGCETDLGAPESCGLSCGRRADCTALPGVARAGCERGACTIVECAPGRLDCDRRADTGCEAGLSADAACGASCGETVDCRLAPGAAGGACVDGRCSIAACTAGRADCNRDPADGCELLLDDDYGACGPEDCGGAGSCRIGSVAGDLDAGEGPLLFEGRGEAWLVFELREDYTCCVRALTATVTLEVPDGVDYDLLTRCDGCAEQGPSGVRGPGEDEAVELRWEDTRYRNDDRDVYLEVRFAGGGGPGCGQWRLSVRGFTDVPFASCF